MRRRTSSPPTQLALDLTRDALQLPTPQSTMPLLQALADLLLGALGEPVEKPACAKQDRGGDNEPEDHA